VESAEQPRAAAAAIDTAILGAGPAGLTAAYTLAARGRTGVVFEADSIVGGISQTVEFKGYRFDLGGHRFFTKLKAVERLWEETLGSEFLTRPRLSRIYYDGKYFSYPLKAREVRTRLGLIESARCVLSYLASRARPQRQADTFEEWVTARFGRRLYDAFFRAYTEKVWGIPGSEIRSEWAAQRIKNFSLPKALFSALGLRRGHVTTLIEQFRYPRLGPGQMWETLARQVEDAGVPVRLEHRCVALKSRGKRIESVTVRAQGGEQEHYVERVLSTLPLTDLVECMRPAAPPEVIEAASKLRYRALCLVALVTTEETPFPDNWIYLHDPGTRAGRVQNFGAWSDAMVQPGMTCLGVEYFCFEGDDVWQLGNREAVELAREELARIGLIDPAQVVDGTKVHVPKAYPMYDRNYEEAVGVIRNWVAGFENLETCGRNGLHRYNNQDHSMWTAILAMQNLLEGADHDVWSVNTEDEYLEEGEVVDAIGVSDAPRELGGALLDPIRRMQAADA